MFLRSKFWWAGLGSLGLLVVATIGLLPSLVASPYLAEDLTRYLFSSWKVPVVVDSYQVGWADPLVLQGISAEYEGREVIHIRQATTELPLRRLFNANNDYGTVHIDELQASIQMFGHESNIELISGVDENMMMDIVIERANVTLSDEQGFQWAELRDIPLAVRIQQSDNGQVTSIDPALLIEKGSIYLARDKYVPAQLRNLIKQDYIAANVTLELLDFQKWTQSPESSTYRFRLTIHSLDIKNRMLASMVRTALDQMPIDEESGRRGVFYVIFENGEERVESHWSQ